MPEEDKPEKTLFIITTDGMENASRQYTYEKVRKMVEKKKKKQHWEFIFLGANIDAIQVANRFGVCANRAVRFENDGMGHQLNFEVMSHMVGCARRASSAEDMERGFDQDGALSLIREDYEELQEISKSKETIETVTDEIRKGLKARMGDLTDQEQKYARVLFGLDGEKIHTYEEAGKKFGMTTERMHQMAAKIKRKLIHPSESKKLKDYLDQE